MKSFELTTPTGPVTLLWNNWAMHRFCELNGGMPISQMLEIYSSEKLTFKHVITMLQAASDSAGKVINEREASELIDAGGGLQFSGSQILSFIQYTMTNMLPELPKEEDTGEKKS